MAGGNLVLGAAWNLGTADCRVFVESLRKYYQGDVILLVASKGSRALVRYLRSHGITPVYFDCPFWMLMHLQLARYVRYGEILRGSSDEYQRVLLTDVSDVVFQADPFALLPDGELLCFLEAAGRTVGQCDENSRWIQQIIGTEGFEAVKNFEISCSGETIGSHQAILGYIDLLLAHIDAARLVQLRHARGHDQGIHNFLLHIGALPKARKIPNGQHVYTLGFVPESEFTLGANGTIVAPGERLCPIIHQYNYKPACLRHVRLAYGVAHP